MNDFLSLDAIGAYITFITIITAITQMVKSPIDSISNKLFKKTFTTNYVVFFVAYAMYFTFKILTGSIVDGSLVFVVFCNAIVIGFGSVGTYTVLTNSKKTAINQPNTEITE